MRSLLLPQRPVLNREISVEEEEGRVVLRLPGRGSISLAGGLASAFAELRPHLDGEQTLDAVLEAMAESWEPEAVEALVHKLFMRNVVREAIEAPVSDSESELAVRLPMQFDPERLQADFARLAGLERMPQPGLYHNGEWAGLSLYSPGGRADTASADVTTEAPRPTPLLERSPYFKEVLDSLRCEKITVRLLELPPGGRIDYHTDRALNFTYGVIRVHIPIVTHQDVIFYIANRRFSWQPGELWYGDFSFPHMVENRSNLVRVHMVCDLMLNPFVMGLFPEWFVTKKRAEGITLTLPAVELPAQTLSNFTGRIKLPRQYFPWLAPEGESIELSLALVGDRLMLLKDDRPCLGLQAVADDEFCFVGRGSGVRIRFKDGAAQLLVLGLPDNATMNWAESWLDEDVATREIPLEFTR
jgi:hypothetical protein